MFTAALVTIASVNFDRSVEFYGQLFAATPQPYIPHVYAEYAISGLRLGIFCPQSSHQAEFGQPQQSGMSLCLEVKSLEQAIAQLADLGYPVSGQITIASHGREIYAYDPDGNRLILHQSVGA
jgi:predicted enzyme related to lactoylglutathione lyase